MMPFLGVLVLLWAPWSGTPWPDIGFARPRSLPLLGADPINQTYHYLAGNPAMLPGAVLTMVAAGFGEETVFRGFLFERLGKLFGPGTAARVAIVLITTALFASMHYPIRDGRGLNRPSSQGRCSA
jgi:membrane protease YdiL (CAAX protease family)